MGMEIGFRSEIYLLFLGGAKGVMMSQKKNQTDCMWETRLCSV
jgi:hypothetical protein